MLTGYLSPQYAQSFAEFGVPTHLPKCDGWILERPILGHSYRDAMGCYPLFCCHDWSQLGADLAVLERKLVSIALVTDPFGTYKEADLKESFELVKHFKDHLVVRLDGPPDAFVTRHHRYYARRSLKKVHVEHCDNPIDHLDTWCCLYDGLVRRHNLHGIKAFSRGAFSHQLTMPGIIMFRATCDRQCCAAQLWFIHGRTAYSHLTAVGDRGYATRASYGLYWEAIRWFFEHRPDGVRWLDLGAGAGVGEEHDGLTKFKQGWSNAAKPVYFCGRVLNADAYEELVKGVANATPDYFPAYRAGELC